MHHNQKTGGIGEQHAIEYLRNKDYLIIGKNVTSRWGEIDIIAEKNKKIYFIEVKARYDSSKGRPYEAVNYRKLSHLSRTIKYWILSNNLEKRKFQLDVIGILLNPNKTVRELKHYENIGIKGY